MIVYILLILLILSVILNFLLYSVLERDCLNIFKYI